MRYKPIDRGEWNSWFAWRPVTTKSGEVVWFARVERKRVDLEPQIDDAYGTFPLHTWVYR